MSKVPNIVLKSDIHSKNGIKDAFCTAELQYLYNSGGTRGDIKIGTRGGTRGGIRSGIRGGWSGIKGGKQSAGHEGSHGSGCSLSLDALGFHEERHLVTITIIFVMMTMIIIVITISINTG